MILGTLENSIVEMMTASVGYFLPELEELSNTK